MTAPPPGPAATPTSAPDPAPAPAANTSRGRYDLPLIVGSLALIFALVTVIALNPEATSTTANAIFARGTELFGTYTLIFAFVNLLLLIGLALSKFGRIRLGQDEPEYSNFNWVAMMLAAGLGSATMVWAFVEWIYYYTKPALGIAPESATAYEYAVAYNFFHWGFSAWALYCIVALPVAYHFHVRRSPGLSLSATFTSITGIKERRWINLVLDFVFVLTVFGGLSITLGLSIPLISATLGRVFGFEATFAVNVVIVLLISVLYSFSSFIGIQKGMRRISNAATKLAIAFAVGVLVVGPTMFIIKNTLNSFGLMVQNFVQMSLWTDPVGNGGFPEGWTVFYWLYWITYTPFMALFVAKISKGRTVRALIANMLVAGTLGLTMYFGVFQNFSMSLDMNGTLDAPAILESSGQEGYLLAALEQLPVSWAFMLTFAVVSVLYLATTLDSASFTLASAATKGLTNTEEPAAWLRLFWCIMIAAVPLTMIFIDADLNTIKTSALITSIPLTFIIIALVIGLFRAMRQDYGHIPAERITETAVAPADVPPAQQAAPVDGEHST